MNTAACPAAEDYRGLLSGLAAPEAIESLAAHLERCPACLETFCGLYANDAVVRSLRGNHPPPAEADRRALESLIARLARRDGGAAEETGPYTSADGGTLVSSGGTGGPTVGYDFLAPPEQPGELGRLGALRVLRVIGEGGMGIVFDAEDPLLRRRVALKVMKPALAASEGMRRRFLREARMVAALEHDHVVTIHQVGEDRGVPFLVMPLLKGKSLEERLKEEHVLPDEEVVRVGRETAEGLAAAHELGMVHRDVKPTNVWLEGARGRVKVLDFGLARQAEGESVLSGPQVMAGTPAYMAPEQARCEKIDARADLFALGCMLYRMCTGTLPFLRANVPATIHAVTHDQPRPPAEVNAAVRPALSDLVMQLLEKDPAARPASARLVAERLAALALPPTFVAGTGVSAAPPEAPRPPAPHAARPASRRWRRWPAATAAPVAAVLAVGYLFGGVIVRFATDRGEVVLEVNDPAAEVTVRDGGAEILDRRTRRRFTLAAGKHDLEVTVTDPDGELHFFTKSFSLRRGGVEVINVREELGRAAPAAAAAGDRAAAEWVLSMGGTLDVSSRKREVRAAEDLPAGHLLVVRVALNDPRVSDEGLAHLAHLPDLRHLSLNGCKGVGDAGLRRLYDLAGLRELDLAGTGATSAGVTALQKALPNCHVNTGAGSGTADAPAAPAASAERRATQWVISLGGKVIIQHPSGEQEVRSVNDMPAGAFVVRVSLNHTRVSDDGLANLKSMPHLQDLRLRGCTEVTDAGLTHVATLKDLRALDAGMTQCSDGGLARLAALAGLRELYLYSTKITDDGLRHLKSMSKLQILGISGTNVTDEGLANLRALKNLEILNVSDTKVTDTGMKHLLALTNLREICLQNTRVSVAGLAQLQASPALAELDLGNVEWAQDAVMKEIPKFKKLRVLNLLTANVSDAGLIHLRTLTDLEALSLEGPAISDAGIAHVRELKRLRVLQLEYTRLSDAGMVDLLANLPNLQHIDLRGTRVSDASVAAIARRYPQLQSLNLQDARVSAKGYATLTGAYPKADIKWSEPNYTAAVGVLAAGGTARVRSREDGRERVIRAAGELPKGYFFVTGIRLADVAKVPAEVTRDLAALKDPEFDRLSAVDYSGVSLGEEDLDGLLQSLPRTVVDLSLARTQATDGLLPRLAKTFPGLRRLDLERCHVVGRGLTALQGFTELRELNLASTRMTDLFAEELGKLTQLERLSLAGCDVGDDGLRQLRSMANLRELNLTATRVSAAAVAAAREALPGCHIESGPAAPK